MYTYRCPDHPFEMPLRPFSMLFWLYLFFFRFRKFGGRGRRCVLITTEEMK